MHSAVRSASLTARCRASASALIRRGGFGCEDGVDLALDRRRRAGPLAPLDHEGTALAAGRAVPGGGRGVRYAEVSLGQAAVPFHDQVGDVAAASVIDIGGFLRLGFRPLALAALWSWCWLLLRRERIADSAFVDLWQGYTSSCCEGSDHRSGPSFVSVQRDRSLVHRVTPYRTAISRSTASQGRVGSAIIAFLIRCRSPAGTFTSAPSSASTSSSIFSWMAACLRMRR